MKIEETIRIELTPKEVSELIIKHIKETEGIDVNYVDFQVHGEYAADDWQARYGKTYSMTKVLCKGKKIKE